MNGGTIVAYRMEPGQVHPVPITAAEFFLPPGITDLVGLARRAGRARPVPAVLSP